MNIQKVIPKVLFSIQSFEALSDSSGSVYFDKQIFKFLFFQMTILFYMFRDIIEKKRC